MPGSETQYGAGWASSSGGSPLEELTLPSGNVCLVQAADLSVLARYGVLDKFDTLTSKVDEKVVAPARRGGVTTSKGRQKNAEMSSQELADLFGMVDYMLVACVVEPHVELAPAPKCQVCGWEGTDWRDHRPKEYHAPKPEPRQKGVVYSDAIAMPDKMAIFNFAVRGFRDLEQFRFDLDKLPETVVPVESLPRAARRSAARSGTPRKNVAK